MPAPRTAHRRRAESRCAVRSVPRRTRPRIAPGGGPRSMPPPAGSPRSPRGRDRRCRPPREKIEHPEVAVAVVRDRVCLRKRLLEPETLEIQQRERLERISASVAGGRSSRTCASPSSSVSWRSASDRSMSASMRSGRGRKRRRHAERVGAPEHSAKSRPGTARQGNGRTSLISARRLSSESRQSASQSSWSGSRATGRGGWTKMTPRSTSAACAAPMSGTR